jgi:hypothetical protein
MSDDDHQTSDDILFDFVRQIKFFFSLLFVVSDDKNSLIVLMNMCNSIFKLILFAKT